MSIWEYVKVTENRTDLDRKVWTFEMSSEGIRAVCWTREHRQTIRHQWRREEWWDRSYGSPMAVPPEVAESALKAFRDLVQFADGDTVMSRAPWILEHPVKITVYHNDLKREVWTFRRYENGVGLESWRREHRKPRGRKWRAGDGWLRGAYASSGARPDVPPDVADEAVRQFRNRIVFADGKM